MIIVSCTSVGVSQRAAVGASRLHFGELQVLLAVEEETIVVQKKTLQDEKGEITTSWVRVVTKRVRGRGTGREKKEYKRLVILTCSGLLKECMNNQQVSVIVYLFRHL